MDLRLHESMKDLNERFDETWEAHADRETLKLLRDAINQLTNPPKQKVRLVYSEDSVVTDLFLNGDYVGADPTVQMSAARALELLGFEVEEEWLGEEYEVEDEE